MRAAVVHIRHTSVIPRGDGDQHYVRRLHSPLMGLSCRAMNARGEPCQSTSVDESGLCATHAGKTSLGTAEGAHAAATASAKARRERAAERRRTALDWMAVVPSPIPRGNGRQSAGARPSTGWLLP
jgi:hypothetical protein